MINTRLVMALEELFKEEPFDLENDIFVIYANRGSIRVTDIEDSGYIIDHEGIYDEYDIE